MKNEITVMLNKIETCQSFVRDAESFESDIDIISGRFIIDAKSILGVFSLDISKPVNVRILSDDELEIKRFNELMHKYSV